MDSNEFVKKLSALPEVEPDDIDTAMLREAQEVNDDTAVPLEDFKRDLEEFSGKFVLRIPRSLHRSLKEAADREGVSLNQYVLYKLAR
ncbi:MAG: toxin-antitoxin system HicB family antitoxin [Oscillospiraceae bacterium]|nr:toxin-antitoxin system HicB family antitoxin [Oscillospiraceae bacterium]